MVKLYLVDYVLFGFNEYPLGKIRKTSPRFVARIYGG